MGKAVGIRELKAHLSRYVREASEGDEVLVSDRGRVVARLSPAVPSETPQAQALLLKLSAEGKIVLPSVRREESPPPVRKKLKGSPFSDAVLEGRR